MNLSNLIEQKRKQKMRQAQKKTAKTLATGVSLGALAGALSGILFAPKSGKETRANIKSTAQDMNKKVKEKTQVATSTCKSNVANAKEKIKEYLENKKATNNLPEEKEAETVDATSTEKTEEKETI